jgi:curli biogenesis system outer membrane secretion channel CsgG
MINYKLIKRTSLSVLILFFLFPDTNAFSGYEVSAENNPITIAIIPLEYRGDYRYARANVGEQISALLTDYMVNQQVNFQLVERDRLNTILSEQNLIRSGVVDPSRAVDLGRLLGADALIFGTVTQFNLESTGRVRVGGVGVGGTRGRVSLTARMVNAESGVILGSVQGSGSATGASFDANVQNVSFRGAEFMESAIGRATYQAVDDVGANLVTMVSSNAGKVTRPAVRDVRMGKIVQLLENGVIINVGANDGVREKQQLQIARMMQVEGVSETVRIPIGTIEITSVQNSASVAVFVDGGTAVNVGDVVLFE